MFAFDYSRAPLVLALQLTLDAIQQLPSTHLFPTCIHTSLDVEIQKSIFCIQKSIFKDKHCAQESHVI